MHPFHVAASIYKSQDSQIISQHTICDDHPFLKGYGSHTRREVVADATSQRHITKGEAKPSKLAYKRD
ncbi:hypothetical protein J2T09_002232 [Neorhizobium huautlense]|uniref:Transposase n=1 Tax=Neorhizobium huautlense TaxID=67774 RepID=A0ABT9PSQ0_9HYPH|nr:hypothetical protein [Neorhizobium huautlense]